MLVIITGGSGFLGSNLAKFFIRQNHKIIIIDRVKNNNLYSKDYIFYKCDLNDKKNLEKIKIDQENILLHCAGQPSAAKSFEDPITDLKTNILTTVNILDWAKKNKTKKIIYASTFNVYKENSKNIKLKETDACEAKSLYAISKKSAENYIRLYGSHLGIKWNILRMFNIYGPGQNPKNNFLGMISIFLNMAKSNKEIIVKGSLERFRDFVFIDDVVEVWYKIAISTEHFNKIYNLGSGKKTKLNFLIKKIIEISNSKSLIKQTEGTPGDFKGCYANIDLLKKDFNYTPRVSLNLGLKIFNKWLDKFYEY